MAPIIPVNILRHEIIGLHVRISASSDSNIVGLKGTIVDETKNMFCIRDGERLRTLPKQTSVFQFRLPDGKIVLVDGRHMIGQPENRLKTRMRSW